MIVGRMGTLFPVSLTQPLTASNFDGFLGSSPHGSETAQFLPRAFQPSRNSCSRSWHYDHMWTLAELLGQGVVA